MEKSSQKSEIVIIPNPNQLILLRNLQKELCSIPTFPLCLRCALLKDFSDIISKNEAKDLYIEKNKIFLKVCLNVNGTDGEGKIELGEALSQIHELPSPKIKKISPFKIAQMKTNEYKNGREWKITQEKWVKF